MDTSIKTLIPAYDSIESKRKSDPQFTICLLDDNSAFLRNTDSHHKTTLYPPPNAQIIDQMVNSIRLNRLVVLLRNSSIAVYQRHKETCLLE